MLRRATVLMLKMLLKMNGATVYQVRAGLFACDEQQLLPGCIAN
jgi:hypothetical protein